MNRTNPTKSNIAAQTLACFWTIIALGCFASGCAEDGDAVAVATDAQVHQQDGAKTGSVDVEAAADAAAKPAVTWHGGVGALITQHCASCHTASGIGPFRLDRAADWKTMAQPAWHAITTGSMPPFMADPSCGKFAKVRTLTTSDKAYIEQWLSDGQPLGTPDPKTSPKPSADLNLPKTHSAVMPVAYTAKTTTNDDYRCFLLDLDFPEDTYLSGAQVVPGAKDLVHHVLVYALTGEQRKTAEKSEAKHTEPGYPCFGGPLSGTGGGQVLNQFAGGFPIQIAAWVPGLEPTIRPQGSATRIPKGSRIVMQVHYNVVGGKTAPDKTRIDMILSTVEPKRLLATRPLLIHDLDIQPNMTTAEQRLFRYYGDKPLKIYTLTPHMHLLASAFKATVVRADDKEECAISVPHWDFQWQQGYARPEADPLVLNNGDGIRVRCVYDNTAANQPKLDGKQITPKAVKWGDGSFDEMCMLYMDMSEDFAPSPPADAKSCHGFSACEAKCKADGRMDCIMSCGAVPATCQTCAIQQMLSCGASKCPLALLGAQTCLTNCLVGAAILGSNTGACLKAECGEKYKNARECMDPVLTGKSCVSKLAACGL